MGAVLNAKALPRPPCIKGNRGHGSRRRALIALGLEHHAFEGDTVKSVLKLTCIMALRQRSVTRL
jgi:hypothetical protein